jgi:hypothetical protein
MKTVAEITKMLDDWISTRPFESRRAYSLGYRRRLIHDLHLLQTVPVTAGLFKLHEKTLRKYIAIFNWQTKPTVL